MNRKPIQDCRLYGILDLGYVTASHAPRVLERMLRGGVDIVQLRAKNQPREIVATLARELFPIAASVGVPFIINDDPALAGELGVDGAHVGQEDIPVPEARRLAGPRRIVGKSTHSLAQAVEAISSPEAMPDYIGFGPLFVTATKPDYAPIGTAEIRRVHELISIPVFCIGGIKRENLETVLAAGARRVVIVSGILQAQDVEGYCREVKERLG